MAMEVLQASVPSSNIAFCTIFAIAQDSMWYDLYFVRNIVSTFISCNRLPVLSLIKGFCHYFWPFTFTHISCTSSLITKTCLFYSYKPRLSGSEPVFLARAAFIYPSCWRGDLWLLSSNQKDCRVQELGSQTFNAASLLLLMLDHIHWLYHWIT